MLESIPDAPTPGRMRLSVFILPITLLSLACSQDGPSATVSNDARASTVRFDSIFPRNSQLTMEEEDGIILVEPEVSIDPQGGFLVADRREARLLRYDVDGTLIWYAGGKGGGPSEFSSVTAVRRLASGRIIVSDFPGKIAVFTAEGDSLLTTYQTGFRQLEEFEVLNDSTLLVAALYGDGIEVPRLHLWNVERNEVTKSFFEPLSASPNRDAAIMAGWTRIALHGDTIAAIFATSDTIYFFTTDGMPIRRLNVPSNHFRRVGQGVSLQRGTDPQAAAEFLSSFDLIADIHWTDAGQLVIPYQQVDPNQALDRIWHLVVFDITRDRAIEMRRVPRLLTLDHVNDRFIFISPSDQWPNQWITSAIAPLR